MVPARIPQAVLKTSASRVLAGSMNQDRVRLESELIWRIQMKMRTNFALAALAFLPTLGFATTPTITSVSGTVQTGQTLTVTGTTMVDHNTSNWNMNGIDWNFEGASYGADGYDVPTDDNMGVCARISFCWYHLRFLRFGYSGTKAFDFTRVALGPVTSRTRRMLYLGLRQSGVWR